MSASKISTPLSSVTLYITMTNYSTHIIQEAQLPRKESVDRFRAVAGHSTLQVTDFGANRTSVCGKFLLVNNLHPVPISHRFQVITGRVVLFISSAGRGASL